MQSIIEELYFGNLEPQSNPYHNTRRFQQAMSELVQAEKELINSLPDKDIYEKFDKAVSTVNGMTDTGKYIQGFRHGARFMLDMLRDN